jgi:hypothetical protein
MNGTGHTILFQVALDRMTPTARTAVTKLLTENTKNPEENGFELPAADGFLPTQSEYPDQWKSYARENKLPNTESQLHFDNVPIGPLASSQPSPNRPGGASQIEQQKTIAENTSADPALRANATRWIVHEYGDIGAQPLHVINYFSQQFPHGDGGGNAFNLNWGGSGKWDTELHSLMDQGGVQPDAGGNSVGNYKDIDGAFTSDDQTFVQQKAKDIEARFPISLSDPSVLDQNPKDWEATLAKQANDQVYPLFTPGETVTANDPRMGKIENLMDGNVALAGARLAAWADATFDPNTAGQIAS